MAVRTIIEELGLSHAQFNALKSLAETDLSATAIIEKLKGSEGAIRRTTGLQAIRAFRDIVETRPYLKSVGYDKKLNPARIPRALGDQLRRYSYEIKFTVRAEDSDELSTLYRNFSTNELMTKQDVVDQWLEAFNEGAQSYNYDVEDYEVSAITEDINQRPD